jgi:cell division protein FtsI (penicillin-binding protein 3)
MAYGYEVELTPLQILTLYNAVANNGVMVKPRFVREIREMGNTVEKYYPQVINKRLCSKATIGKLRKMMEGVVERGTAKGCFKGAIYSVAGKTGTAQINFTEKGREKMTYRASFVGYFPAGNPKYSCIVVITNPKSRDYYGGTVSAPVFKDIADKVYSIFFNKYLDEKPQKIKKVMPAVAKVINSNDYRKIFNAMNLTGNNPPVKTDMTCLSIDTLLRASEMKMDKKAGVPNVTGMGLKDAVFTLEKAGFKVRVSGRGTVRNQALASPGEVKLDLM